MRNSYYFRIHKNYVFLTAIFLFLFMLLEAVSYSFLAYRYRHLDSKEKSKDEMEDIYYKKSEYHPYRWYRLPSNYSGKLVKLDSQGFRNDASIFGLEGKKILAFYGGSTMFSTTTDQDSTIPSIINQHQYKSIFIAANFGIGGYASSAELSTFAETSRLYKNIELAVFYDGVNEVARYVERIQDGNRDRQFDVMSYPFMTGLDASIYKKYPGQRPYSFPFSLYITKKALLNWKKNLQAIPEIDYVAASKSIANIYVENARDISVIGKARGIRTIFILQPVIYSTDNLSPSEMDIKNKAISVDMNKIYLFSYREIITSLNKEGIDFLDMSAALSDKDPSQNFFVDYCHLNADGNRHVAKKIISAINHKFSDIGGGS